MKKKIAVLVVTLLVTGVTIVHAQSSEIIVQGNSLTEKLDWLNAFAQSNGTYIIEINTDERVTSQNITYSGKNNITITLKGNNGNRTIRLSSRYERLTVGSGITLILDNNITLQGVGSHPNTSSTGGVVYVVSNGRLIMNKGASIIHDTSYDNGHYSSYPDGHGVYLDGGSFTMNDGLITGKRGYGVFLRDGIFIMNDGTISSNSFGGVASQFGNGTFTMTGGSITGNWGGVSMGAGTFTMSGGSISGNKKHSNNSNYGGGVYISNSNSSFIMSGGEIKGNTTDFGGGVSVSNGGNFTINGGEISGNTAHSDGGGVHGYFTMNNGIISGNTARRNGGGVYINGTFNMSGGIISGNTAREYGGGVYVYMVVDSWTGRLSGGIFIKTGGTITGFSNDPNNGNAIKENSGTARNFRGHSAYAGLSDNVLKIKETTAGPEDSMSFGEQVDRFSYSPTFSGAWDN